MSIRTLKRRHWMLIGLLVGASVAFVQLAWGGVGRAPVGMGQAEFERLLQAPPALGKYAALEEINVIPVDDLYWVRGQRRYPLADGSGFEFRTEWLALRERQYKPIDPALRPRAETQAAEYTVRTFLADAAARDPRVQYRYAWEKDAKIVWPVCVLGGALLIGGVWPILLRSLIAVDNPADHYDLSRFASSEPTTEPPSDQQKLPQMEAELESKLAGKEAGTTLTPADISPTPKALSNAPLAPLPDCSQAKKDYEGEFYPTEAHAHTPKSFDEQ